MNKQEKIKLSVIIKTHNCDDFLCETLEAINNVDEIIILDNHSTDETIDIIKEYKAKLIYIDKTNYSLALNQAISESINDWILVLDEDEILPYKLLLKIEEYIKNPKKNKYAISIPIKIFYMKKEIKSFYQKDCLKVFKKGYCEFKNNYSFDLKLKQGKMHKFQKTNQNDYNILKFVDNDISEKINEIIEKNRNIIKDRQSKNHSFFIKPLFIFIKYFIFKKGFLDGKYGFIFAKMKFFEEFILNVMALEKNFKGEKYDI